MAYIITDVDFIVEQVRIRELSPAPTGKRQFNVADANVPNAITPGKYKYTVAGGFEVVENYSNNEVIDEFKITWLQLDNWAKELTIQNSVVRDRGIEFINSCRMRLKSVYQDSSITDSNKAKIAKAIRQGALDIDSVPAFVGAIDQFSSSPSVQYFWSDLEGNRKNLSDSATAFALVANFKPYDLSWLV